MMHDEYAYANPGVQTKPLHLLNIRRTQVALASVSGN